MRWWPWETRRVGTQSWVVRPWRPHQDPRVHGAVALLVGATTVAAVWRLQGAEAGLAARAGATVLTTMLLMWAWRTWKT